MLKQKQLQTLLMLSFLQKKIFTIDRDVRYDDLFENLQIF